MARAEFDLIFRYLAGFGAGPGVSLGVGDDAAALAIPPGHELLVSTDTQVEGVHFPPDSLPESLAYRAVATAASDLAAMAADPLAMTLALTLPEADELWLHSFSMGLGDVVRDIGLPLVGGDLTRGPLSLSVTVLGTAPAGRYLTRAGARPGDRLCVTGTLGDAACALALLEGRCQGADLLDPDEQEWLEARFFRPSARLVLASWLREYATACIDVSDGLLADTGHLAAASGVACRIASEQLPLSRALSRLPRKQVETWALTGGDDYELVFSVPPGPPLPEGTRVIGEVVAGEGVSCDGVDFQGGGYEHFSA